MTTLEGNQTRFMIANTESECQIYGMFHDWNFWIFQYVTALNLPVPIRRWLDIADKPEFLAFQQYLVPPYDIS